MSGGGKVYFFDSKGIQRTGWRKVGSNYNFFNINTKANGYRKQNCTVNGIKLDANGNAVLSTARQKRKAADMVKVAEWVDKIVTPGKSKSQHLKQVFDYLRKSVRYKYVGSWKGNKDDNYDLWDLEYVLKNKRADCHPYAATFAYMANALGYSNTNIVSAITHSFVQIDGKYYDVSLARNNLKSYKLFGMKNYGYSKKAIRSVNY